MVVTNNKKPSGYGVYNSSGAGGSTRLGNSPSQAPDSTLLQPQVSGGFGQSSFTHHKAAPVELNPSSDPSKKVTDARLQKIISALATLEIKRLRASGQPATPAAVLHGVARRAGELAKSPNSRELLSEIGKGNLGFEPKYDSESYVDQMLNTIRDGLGGQLPTAPASPLYGTALHNLLQGASGF
jgi:hypothetical protein